MGACCSSHTSSKRDVIILVVGLDNSGKTTLTRTIAGGAFAKAYPPHNGEQKSINNAPFYFPFFPPLSDIDPFIVPTVGFSDPVKKRLFGWDVVFYDLGGGARIRGVWPQYFADVHGIIFVVDCADPARIPEATKELHQAMSHPMVVGKPLVM